MKVTVDWENTDEKSIIYYTFVQGWGWQDVYDALKQAGEMISGVSHRVDVIMDFRTANFLPKSALSQIKRAYDNPKPENIGMTVIVTPNPFLNSMVSLAKKIWGENTVWQLEFVKTVEEAYATIARYSQSQEKKADG